MWVQKVLVSEYYQHKSSVEDMKIVSDSLEQKIGVTRVSECDLHVLLWRGGWRGGFGLCSVCVCVHACMRACMYIHYCMSVYGSGCQVAVVWLRLEVGYMWLCIYGTVCGCVDVCVSVLVSVCVSVCLWLCPCLHTVYV